MARFALGGFRGIRARRAPTALLGGLVTLAGTLMLIGAAVEGGQASADTTPFELFCTGTPVGSLVFNDVVLTGTLSPAAPAAGQQFSLENFQAQVTIPASVVTLASEVGNTSLSGTATTSISASGATPSSMSTGSMTYDAPIPNPVPSSGLQFDVPSTPATLGPFTANSSNVALSLGSTISLTFTDIALPGYPGFTCSSYPNDVLPAGLTNQLPPGLPLTPVIAYAGTAPPPPPADNLTGPYELYCPGTPVGDLDFNGVTTSATVSPSSPTAGGQFQVTGYQVQIPVPAGPVSSAVGLSNSSFVGLATSELDAYGAGPAQVPTGNLGFDVAIPDPVPSSGVTVDLPTAPTTVGPFTADGGPVTIAQDQSILVVAELSGKAFRMSCTAYPNDSIATSGSTAVPPPSRPIRPIVAMATASGTPISTTTTVGKGGLPGGTTPAGSPYELYCPGTPVGDIAVNDVTTTGSITPSTLNEGDSFQVTGVQTQFSIPQATAQELESLGLTSLSGNLSLFLNVQGAQFPYYVYGVVSTGPTTTTTTTASSSGSSGSGSSSGGSSVTTVPPGSGTYYPPYPYPPYGQGGFVDLSFNATLPSPVPSTGVQFTATQSSPTPPYQQSFTAAGGPITVTVSGADLNIHAFNSRFGLFCNTLTNDAVPTGLSLREPYIDMTAPIVATGSATVVPPPPGPPGAYELFCPGTPVGNVALNNVVTSATIPQSLTSGQSFSVTGYQTAVTLPASIVSAAAALGNTSITGSATVTLDATGATPSSMSTGALSFSVSIPSPVPTGGLTFDVPSTATSIGPFTATGSAVTVEEDSSISLTLDISGNNLTLTCSAYPDNTVPSGIIIGIPNGQRISPVIATSGTPVPPPTPTGSYELYCPGTPVGSIALNGVTSAATITPANPAPGQQFQVTDYQTTVVLPAAIATAAAALGNTAITGTATVTIDAAGATPASTSSSFSFDVPIPNPVPPSGVTMSIPSTPATIGSFTAGSGAISISAGDQVQLALTVSGNTLSLDCTAYADNSVQGGITTVTPSGSPVSPALATADALTTDTTSTTTTSTSVPDSTTSTSDPGTTTTTASGGTTTTTGADGATTTTSGGGSGGGGGGGGTTTTAGPATRSNGGSTVTASSGALAFTGPGSTMRFTALAGAALLLLGLLILVVADVPEQLRRRLAAVYSTADLMRSRSTWHSLGGALARAGAMAHVAARQPERIAKAAVSVVRSKAGWLVGR